MKKTLLTLSVIILFCGVSFGQGLLLFNLDGSPIGNGDTIYVFGDTTTGIAMVSHAMVKNDGAASKQVKVRKIEISLIPGTTNTFCWGLCFPPTTYVSPSPIAISAGATDTSDFSGDYTPNGQIGTSLIAYKFFNINDLNDTVMVVVSYNATGVGISNVSENKVIFSNAYPNPANSYTVFNYNLPLSSTNPKIVIRDLLGSVVGESMLSGNRGNAVISTSELKSGIYFYSLMVNDRIFTTRKLVVQH
jgi:hypothetical protein